MGLSCLLIKERVAFGDRAIPIHTRTLGFGVPPHVMGMYWRVVRPYGTDRSACC